MPSKIAFHVLARLGIIPPDWTRDKLSIDIYWFCFSGKNAVIVIATAALAWSLTLADVDIESHIALTGNVTEGLPPLRPPNFNMPDIFQVRNLIESIELWIIRNERDDQDTYLKEQSCKPLFILCGSSLRGVEWIHCLFLFSLVLRKMQLPYICKIGSFLCSLDNLLQKNVIVFFFGNQFQNGTHLKKGLFLTYFSHF